MDMKRKLIRQGGGGGLTLYIPKRWIDKKKLKPGDEIDIEEQDDDLILSTQNKKDKLKELVIDISEQNMKLIRTAISSAYRRGYDIINLSSSTKLSFTQINKVVDSLIGYVITYQTDNNVKIKNIMTDNFEEVDAIINKLNITIVYFFDKVCQDIEDKDNSGTETLELRNSIIRLRDYCQRMIHISSYGKDRCYEYNNYVYILEKIAGKVYNFMMLKKSLKDKKKVIKELKACKDIFLRLNKSLAKKDVKASYKLNKELRSIKDKAYKEPIHPLFSVLWSNMFSLSSRVISLVV